MNKRWMTGITLAVLTTLLAAGARADEVSLKRDMTSVIALLGLPCGQAVKVVKQAENDHLVTCQDGNRYRVYLNPQGRVVAEKR